MSDPTSRADRRAFLKLAGTLAATAAAGCTLESHPPAVGSGTPTERATGFDRPLLDALGEVVLPSELGTQGRAAAITKFVAWIDGYEPVAEEMHGYGYADIRYLPPDPAPMWRAQLDALDRVARKSRRKSFSQLPNAERLSVLESALSAHAGERLPAPLDASHIAIALLAHWAASPDAHDLAYGARITPSSCRVLGDANAKPLPITGLRA
jgi:hypothetical protein